MMILVVGGGKMGMSHLALCSAYLNKSSVALCDTSWTTRRLFSYLGFRVFSHVEDALENLGRIDGVIIATPTKSHYVLAQWAIENRIPVFVEKPLTLDPDKSHFLASIASSQEVATQVGFVMRYIATFQRLRDLVQEEKLGRVLHYSASMLGNVMTKPPKAGNWQGIFSKGGGCLNEYGPHIIDLSCFIFGRVAQINLATAKSIHCPEADDRMEIQWQHSSGFVGHDIPGNLVIDWSDPSKRKSVIEFNVCCEFATLRVDNSAVEIKWRPDIRLRESQIEEVEAYVRPMNVKYYLRGEEFSLEIAEFLETCTSQKMVDPGARHTHTVPTLHDGYEVDRLIDLIASKAGLK